MEAVQRLIADGVHEATAVGLVTPPVHRSTYRHWVQRYTTFGFEGLIDCRLPEPRETIAEPVQQTVLNLRRNDPAISVQQVVSFIRNHHRRNLSESSAKRILKAAGLHRSSGRPSEKQRDGAGSGELLHLGGMKLVEAAAVSTGYLEALTQTVVEHVAGLPTPDGAQGPDVGDRDERGRFLPSYNERYQKSADDVVGPGFASVELKRELKDPSLFHVKGASPTVVERKLWALMCSPLIGSGEWDGMLTPRGKLLGELCGVEYMPSTLSLFTSELKYAGVASELWETHAHTWHSQTQTWGSPRYAAVLYVDGTSKPIFTNLFSQCTHVSLFNRTMPGLDVVGFHSGYGVPLLYLAHSGRAPLIKAVPKALGGLEQQLGAEIGRIVVIDAEGNAAPFLSGLQQDGRAWVTRLRPDMVKDKEIRNWTPFRPYRDNDRIREGELDLRLGKQGHLTVRLLEIERQNSGQVVHLAASLLLRPQDWKTDEVADLYFARWPNQELNFRAVNQATDIKQVRGYGKRLVQNVAVTTKLEELTKRVERAKVRLAKQTARIKDIEARCTKQAHAVSTSLAAKQTIDDRIDKHLKASKLDAEVIRHLICERKTTEEAAAKSQHKQMQVQAQLDKTHALAKRTAQRLDTYREQQYDLSERRNILAHDVELDSIFNVLKVGLTLLVTYVLRNMLDNARMTPRTFLERIATLPAWSRVTDTHEYLTFPYNKRDPNSMALLAASCSTINAMQLRTRAGVILQIAVQDSSSNTC
jgi:hypothetical protein